MDLNVIFSLSALGAFAAFMVFRLSYKIPLAGALLTLSAAAVLIFIGHSGLGNDLALATFYLFALGIALMVMDHLLALKRMARSGASDAAEVTKK